MAKVSMRYPIYPIDIKKYPLEGTVFNRARDFYLYTASGLRVVDLDAASGSALFGHKPPGLISRIKQALDKGITHNLTTVWKSRFFAQVAKLFPGYVCAKLCTLHYCDNEPNPDAEQAVPLYRLFSGATDNKARELLVVLPLAWDAPLCVLLRPAACTDTDTSREEVFFQDSITGAHGTAYYAKTSAVQYAALCVMAGMAASAAQSGENGKENDNPLGVLKANRAFPDEHKNKHNIFAVTHSVQELQRVKARAAALPLPGGWSQHGVYICTGGDSTNNCEKYREVRELFWSYGFFLPLSPHVPLTLPYFFTKKELKYCHTVMKLV